MADDTIFAEAAETVPLMAILRGFSSGMTLELCERAWSVGIALVEIPVQTPDAVATLAGAAKLAAARGRLVGAGTVTDVALVDAARSAGAGFTVAPGFDEEVARASRSEGMAHLPGVGTATEVQRALAAGFSWLKAFPAAQLGTDWPRAIHGPFPEARFVATGGTTVGSAEDFLAGGADIVALGSALADDTQVEGLRGLVERTRRSLETN